MKRLLKTAVGCVLSVLLLCAALVPSEDAGAATGKARMTRLEFVKQTVQAVEGAVSGGIKTTVPVSPSAAAKVKKAKEDAAGKAHDYAEKYGVTEADAAFIARAVSLGLITEKTFTNYGYYTKRVEAAKILVKADALLYADLYDKEHEEAARKDSYERTSFFAQDYYISLCGDDLNRMFYTDGWEWIESGMNVSQLRNGTTNVVMAGDHVTEDGGRLRTFTDATLGYIKSYRIADLDSVTTSEKDKEAFVKAYALGFITGSPVADYAADRELDPMGKPYATTLKKMIAMLTDEGLRCKFTDDWQMLRVSEKNRPIWEEYYPYVLDSYPNLYYDTSVPGMEYPHLNRDGNWDEQMSRPLEVRVAELLEWDAYRQILTPKELKQVQDTSKPWEYRMASKTLYGELYEFLEKALNTDYRTVETDKEWQAVISKYMGGKWMKDCMADIVKYRTVTECDLIAADISGLAYNGWGYEGKAYVHFRVVQSDYLDEAIKAGGRAGISDAATWTNERGYFLPVAPGKGETAETMAGAGVLDLADFGYKTGEWTDLIVSFVGTEKLHPASELSVTLEDAGLDLSLMHSFTDDCTWLPKIK